MECSTSLLISYIMIRNRSGPRTEPWGTPDLTHSLGERIPFTFTCWVSLFSTSYVYNLNFIRDIKFHYVSNPLNDFEWIIFLSPTSFWINIFQDLCLNFNFMHFSPPSFILFDRNTPCSPTGQYLRSKSRNITAFKDLCLVWVYFAQTQSLYSPRRYARFK